MTRKIYQPYSQLPAIFEGDRLELLFYCINFSVNWGSFPLDRDIKNILGPADFRGYCGGDPGWEIDGCEDDGSALYDELGQRVFRCWALSDISDITPETSHYTVEEVRHYIRIALGNIGIQHPERAAEVNEIILRYSL
jgi:hypothetical protein